MNHLDNLIDDVNRHTGSTNILKAIKSAGPTNPDFIRSTLVDAIKAIDEYKAAEAAMISGDSRTKYEMDLDVNDSMIVKKLSMGTGTYNGEVILTDRFLAVLQTIVDAGGTIITVTTDQIRFKSAYLLVPVSIATDKLPGRWE